MTVRYVQADSRARLSLGTVVTAGSVYIVEEAEDGTVTLVPAVITPRPDVVAPARRPADAAAARVRRPRRRGDSPTAQPDQ